MLWPEKIQAIQERLFHANLSGWLIYDFQKINPLAWEFLQIPKDTHLTRRMFYWIPVSGDPVRLLHAIESHLLAHLPGKTLTYTTRESLASKLQSLLSGKIAMEYSPLQEIPYLSKVDAGLIDWLRTFDLEIISSGDLLQYYTCILTEKQRLSHFEAATFLDKLAAATWQKIRSTPKITDYDVQQWMLQEMQSNGFITDSAPICAINADSANPHFEPSATSPTPIKPGDTILIDLWCKKSEEGSIYGDISRNAVMTTSPRSDYLEIFNLVRAAQKAAINLILSRHKEGKTICGYEADEAARSVIAQAGYGDYFIHRTGHNIYTTPHGPGAHLDSLESKDTRLLLPGTCFSIEPGIYLPGKFGVRLECDMYLGENGQAWVTGGEQDIPARLE